MVQFSFLCGFYPKFFFNPTIQQVGKNILRLMCRQAVVNFPEMNVVA